MKKIENYENVQASGEFKKLTAGGYICKIITVQDRPFNGETGKGDYLYLEYDIADGEFKEYFKDLFEKYGAWRGSFIRSYKEKALGMFKHFTNCIESSNAGYKWDWEEQNLVGKYIGLVLAEEEYIAGDGNTKTKLVVSQIKTVEEIKSGDFKVPTLKKLPENETNTTQFITVDDDQLPF